jgi:hypothetical protein
MNNDFKDTTPNIVFNALSFSDIFRLLLIFPVAIVGLKYCFKYFGDFDEGCRFDALPRTHGAVALGFGTNPSQLRLSKGTILRVQPPRRHRLATLAFSNSLNEPQRRTRTS